MHDLHERPFLGRVEVGRVHDPLRHVVVVGPLEGRVLDFTELPLALEGVIEMVELDRVVHSRTVRKDGRRPVEAALEVDCRAVGRGRNRSIAPISGHVRP